MEGTRPTFNALFNRFASSSAARTDTNLTVVRLCFYQIAVSTLVFPVHTALVLACSCDRPTIFIINRGRVDQLARRIIT
jgi:hypothetical protein